MTQEEINKAAEEYLLGKRCGDVPKSFEEVKDIFKEGVEFAQSKMYSEEEVLELIKKGYYNHYNSLTIEQWFETIKKK